MNLFYRVGQFMVCKGQTMFPWHMPQMITGRHSIYKVPQIIRERELNHVLVITTTGFIKRGTLTPFFDRLEQEEIDVTIYDEVCPDPTIGCIEAAVNCYLNHQCQGIVSVGGGSVMDCAKIVAARIACPDKSVKQMHGFFKVRKQLPFLLAVPTTAGTGSEVTAAAVITDEDIHMKYAVNDVYLLPAYAVLDPELTVGLPAALTAETGMDALTHAVEAYTNRFSMKESNQYAYKATALIMGNLETAYEDGTDRNARAALLEGASLAGRAFTKSFVGYVHAIAHAVGGLYHVPHGKACAIILPLVLEEYGKAIHKPLAELAKAAGIATGEMRQDAMRMIAKIRMMNRNMQIPEYIEEIRKEDVKELANRAHREANPAYPVPVIWSRRKMEQVIYKLIPKS